MQSATHPIVDIDDMKTQVEIYKQLKRNGYVESSEKALASIERSLATLKASAPDEYARYITAIDL